MTVDQSPSAPAEELTYCEVHPDRETGLRCNKCGRLMCVECAVLTPVGYRCRECVRQHDDKFFNATPNDDLKAFAVCGGAGLIAGAIMSALNLGLLFAILLGIPAGGAIAQLAIRATTKRRGRRTGQFATAGVIVGGLIGALVQLSLSTGAPIDLLFTFIFNRRLGLLIFIGLVAAAVYGRFRMRA